MSVKDRPSEDGKTVLVRGDDGRARLVPGGNIVEGEMRDDEEMQDPPPDTSPSP